MELKVIEQDKNKLVVEINGEGHGFCNVLKEELYNDEHVKIAAYSIDHPLVSVPRFMVETDGKITPSEAIAKASKRLVDKANKLKSLAEKELK